MSRGTATFYKPPESTQEHVNRYRCRGLLIDDEKRVARYLESIGYYRLSAYCRPYQNHTEPEHTFKEGTTFQNILDLYIYDRKLRLHVMDALERIEVAIRTVINNHMSLKYGSQWYVDYQHFQRQRKNFNHLQFIGIVKKETGYSGNGNGPDFCRRYFQKYFEPLLPPSWMVAEVLPIGSWSRVYSVLTKPEDRKVISKAFNVRYELFGSWIHALSYLRNICAHHSKLWNLRFVVKPKMKKEFSVVSENDKFFAFTVVIQQLIKSITTNSTWLDTLVEEHLNKCPIQPYEKEMGFIQDWKSLDFMS